MPPRPWAADPDLLSTEFHDATSDRSDVWVIFAVLKADPRQIQPRRGRIAEK